MPAGALQGAAAAGTRSSAAVEGQLAGAGCCPETSLFFLHSVGSPIASWCCVDSEVVPQKSGFCYACNRLSLETAEQLVQL